MTEVTEQQDSLESLYISARSAYFISVWVLVIGKSGHERKYQRTIGRFLVLILLFLSLLSLPFVYLFQVCVAFLWCLLIVKSRAKHVVVYLYIKEMATHSSILAWRIHGQNSLVGYSPWGHTESDTTE